MRQPTCQMSTVCALLGLLMALMVAPSLQAQALGADGDVVMEFVGQVHNPSPAASLQYGYLTSVKGVDAIFRASPQNETTALLTFHNDTTTTHVINNGSMRIINRTGTATIYLDTTPNGDFSKPDSFCDGTPMLTMTLRHQVVIDTVTGAFTATFINTVTASGTCTLGSQ